MPHLHDSGVNSTKVAPTAPGSTRGRRHRSFAAKALPASQPAQYVVKLASDASELRAALRLRYEFFNLELREGLLSAHTTGHDFDPFDAVMDRLIVKCANSCNVVGTYRVQTGEMARRNLGYYSEREFNFAPYEPLRAQVLELGRACIHQEHRNSQVLMLLWKAIAAYALQRGCRYLIGCSSVNSRSQAVGARVYAQLQRFLAPQELLTTPQPDYGFDTNSAFAELADNEEPKVPKLLRAYLAVGTQICGPPALDAEFGTVDFLTFLGLRRVPSGLFARVSPS